MASSRRPTALGSPQAPSAAARAAGLGLLGERRASGDPESRVAPGKDEDEKTAVDGGIAFALRLERFEEATVADPAPPAMAAREPARETIEETTVDDGKLAAGLRRGRPPTIDQLRAAADLARPLPPLQVSLPPVSASGDDDDADDARPTNVAVKAKLVVVGGPDQGKEFGLTGEVTRIGRGLDNDVVLADIAVSRRHCVIELDDDGRYRARDLGSGNGTLVNAVVQMTTPLRDGDQIELGTTRLRFDAPVAESVDAPRPTTLPPSSADDGLDRDAAASERAAPRAGFPTLPMTAREPARALLPPPRRALAAASEPAPLGSSRGPLPGDSGAVAAATEAVEPLPGSLRSASVRVAGLTDDWPRRAAVAGLAVLALVIVVSIAAALSDGGTTPTRSGLPVPAAEPARASAGRGSDVWTAAAEEVVGSAPHRAAPTDDGGAGPAPAGAAEPPDEPHAGPAPWHDAGTGRDPAAGPTVHREDAPKPRPSASADAVRDAEARARALYRRGRFDDAVDALRAAATSAPANRARALRQRADDYAAASVELARGDAARSAKPGAALVAYRRARELDRKLGGDYATELGARLAAVAPRAAAALIAEQRYEAARRVADAADGYGAGSDPMVRRVREALERKAEEFYRAAYRQRKTDPAAARALLERIGSIVPASSPWQVKAAAALTASGAQ